MILCAVVPNRLRSGKNRTLRSRLGISYLTSRDRRERSLLVLVSKIAIRYVL